MFKDIIVSPVTPSKGRESDNGNYTTTPPIPTKMMEDIIVPMRDPDSQAGGLFESGDKVEHGVVGVDYVPPLTANILVITPFLTEDETKHLLFESGVDDVTALPRHFTWQKMTLEDGKTSLITQPVNQAGCGSCWAVATAGVLADRVSIFTYTKPIELSFSYMLSCDNDNLACKGGMPQAAAKFLEHTGIPTNECWNYNWCITNNACLHGPRNEKEDPDTYLPGCQTYKNTCVMCIGENCEKIGVDYKMFKAVPDSTRTLRSADEIKAELFHNGPIVVGYKVFDDFLFGSGGDGDGWSRTGRIYVHGAYKNVSAYQSVNATGDQWKGNHAVAIVGWGVENISKEDIPSEYHDKLVAGDSNTVEVPYWIARNSWGDIWQDDGYFKFAMDPINNECAMDKPLKYKAEDGDQYFGGGTSFCPDVSDITGVPMEDSVCPQKRIKLDMKQGTHGGMPNVNLNPGFFNRPWVRTLGWVLVGLVVIGILILLFFLLRRLYAAWSIPMTSAGLPFDPTVMDPPRQPAPLVPEAAASRTGLPAFIANRPTQNFKQNSPMF